MFRILRLLFIAILAYLPGPKGRYCNRPGHRPGIFQEGISQSERLP